MLDSRDLDYYSVGKKPYWAFGVVAIATESAIA